MIASESEALHNSLHGIWGPVTATLDWCEANYQFSPYIAEMANSFSNLITVAFALHGIRIARENAYPMRFIAGLAGFALIGIGSFAFHATLLFGPQLADELPMIYVASHSLFVLLDTRPGFNITNSRSIAILASTIAFDVLFSLSYLVYRNPVYHQIVFAALALATAARVTYLIRASREHTSKIPEQTKSAMLRMYWKGGALFAAGFVIWNIDNVFCGDITWWKRAVGWPAAFFLEGHSWWHALTAAGTYLMIVGVIYLALCIKDDHRNWELGHMYGLPHVQRVKTFSDTKKVPTAEFVEVLGKERHM